MQVAFWTNVRGRAGNSSLAASIGTAIALEHKYSTVMVNGTSENSIYQLFGMNEERNGTTAYRGVMSALHLARADKLNTNNIRNYCRTLIKNGNLDLFEDSIWCENHTFTESQGAYGKAIDCLKASYDVVCYDIGAGTNNHLSNYILEQSDLIVISVPQDRNQWDNLAKLKKGNSLFKNKTILYAITKYDYQSRVKLSNIKREYRMDPLIDIPYDVDFMDSSNEGKVVDFLIRTFQCKKDEDSYPFITKLKVLTEAIIEIKRDII